MAESKRPEDENEKRSSRDETTFFLFEADFVSKIWIDVPFVKNDSIVKSQSITHNYFVWFVIAETGK